MCIYLSLILLYILCIPPVNKIKQQFIKYKIQRQLINKVKKK